MTPESTPAPVAANPPEPLVESYPSRALQDKNAEELKASAMFTNYSLALNSNYYRARRHEKKEKWSRDYPKDAVLDESFKMAPEVKKAMHAFKSCHPYSCTDEKFLDAVQQLYLDLSKFYGIPTPIVRHIGPWTGSSGASNYMPHAITLVGCRSIITALHEYVHARGYGETAAVWWSTNTFKLVFPKDFEKLRAAQNLPFKPKEAIKSDNNNQGS